MALSRLTQEVVGVGHTAEEALRRARHSRPKERFEARFVPAPLYLPTILERIRPILVAQPIPVYLVGGCVRDALLQRDSHDLDFVVDGSAISLAFNVADALGWPAYVMDRERDIARVVAPGQATVLDFAGLRGPDLIADLQARDFTVNALALPADADTAEAIIDPCGGLGDILAGRLRHTHPRAVTDDPVRAVRAARLAGQLGFTLTPGTIRAARAAVKQVERVSAERLRDEFLKLLMTPDPVAGLIQLADWGWLSRIAPELTALRDVAQSPPHHEPVLAHTFSVLRWLIALERNLVAPSAPDDPRLELAQPTLRAFQLALSDHLERSIEGGLTGRHLLRLGALFHDVGKAPTQTREPDGRIRFLGHETVGAELTARRLRALRVSNEAVQQVKQIVAGHMRPLHLLTETTVSRRAIYRFFKTAQPAGLDIGLVALADHLATYAAADEASWPRLVALVDQLYRHYFEQFEQVIRPRPLVDGHTLIRDLGLPPGPEIGRILRLLEEAQAVGDIHTPDEALALARRIAG